LQPIQNRILMISTGIRAQVGIKVLGRQSRRDPEKGFEVEKVVRTIPGATGVAASRMQGKPYLNIEINRAHLAHHGMRAQDILDVVETGIWRHECFNRPFKDAKRISDSSPSRTRRTANDIEKAWRHAGADGHGNLFRL